MEFGIETLIKVGSVLLGAGIAYGTLKTLLKKHSDQLDKLQRSWAAFHGNATETPGAVPMYIRRAECEKKSGELEENLSKMAETVTGQANSIERVINHARWQLTTKEKLSLAEANEILENGK